MNPQEIQLTAIIMRRVHAVHFMRRVFNPVTVKGAVVAVSLVALFFTVSIPDVIGNMSRLSITEEVGYFLQAYTHTSFIVESAIVLAAAVGIWLVLDIVNNVRHSHSFKFRLKEI